MFARVAQTPVVFRLLGMHPTMYNVTTGRRPYYKMMRWAYGSPFASVICSQDGSGAERWLSELFAPGIPCHLILNGVDPPEDRPGSNPLPDLPSNKTIVMFLGRLEKEKGGEEFVEGFLKALEQEPNGLHAVIFGDGSRAALMRSAVSEGGASDAVTFAGSVPHDQVLGAFKSIDIYVSLNRFGNLSNANLEAMRAGCCMVFPASQPETGTDLATDRLLPAETVLRIRSFDDSGALADAILHLHRNPAERKRRARATDRLAAEFIHGWTERTEYEISLLEEICAQNVAKGVVRRE